MVQEADARPLLSARLVPPAGGLQAGEVLTAVLEILAPYPLALIEVDISLVGVERVDTAYVSRDWRAGVPPLNTDPRRIQRHLLQSGLCAACQTDLANPELRRFVIQSRLPSWLPPTYMGTALRVAYQLSAIIRYRDASSAHESSFAASPLSPPGVSPAQAVLQHAVRAAVVVLPGPGSGGRAVLRALLSPRLAQPTMRCWEVGAGTDLTQALDHLDALARQEPEPEAGSDDEGGGGARMSAGEEDAAHPLPSEDKAASGGEVPDPARTFALRLGDRPLARVTLLPRGVEPGPGPGGKFIPGDTLCVLVELEQRGSLRCMQVEAALEAEEALAPGWRAGGRAWPAPLIVAEAREAVPHAASVGLQLALPRGATPSFCTPLCTLGWALRFVFTAVGQSPMRDPGSTPWRGATEKLTWRLPILVVAPGGIPGEEPNEY
ncbi:hypothetical protein ACKKBG_A19460 [Auxenochlorella protothecoides x Auxenochlorella symbiontica]